MLTNKEAVKVLTAAEQEAARREAEILEARQVSETQSAWHAFMSLHSGYAGLYPWSNGQPDVNNLVSDVQANRDLLMNWARANCVEGITPGTLEKAFAHFRDTGKLAPLPKAVNPEHKDGRRKASNGNEKNMFVQQESRAASEYKNQQPTPPFSKHQLLVMAGQIKGQPANLEAFRNAVKVYGSPAINRILQSEG